MHAEQLVAVLEKFADQPQRLGDLQGEYLSLEMWHETNQQKDGTIERQTQFPDNATQWILSGPHFFVGTPFYKTARANSTLNSDYDCLDLLTLPDDYLPRTNYIPACDAEEYARRTPRVSWTEPGEDEPKKVTEYYRLGYRGMLSQSGERTLIATILPPSVAHIHGVQSTSFKTSDLLLSQCLMSVSLLGDFYIKSTGRSNLMASWASFPVLNLQAKDKVRLLALTCLSNHYAGVWDKSWSCFFSEQRGLVDQIQSRILAPQPAGRA